MISSVPANTKPKMRRSWEMPPASRFPNPLCAFDIMAPMRDEVLKYDHTTTISMLNSDLKLKENIFENPDTAATRDGFGKGLVEAAQADSRVVALSADLTESTRVEEFKAKFPDRFIEVGVAEQNLAALASGFAAYGKIPYITSYAAFNPGRNNEQIRTTISLNNVHVVVCGMHAGISVGPDG